MQPLPARKIYTVSEITQEIRYLLEGNFADVWVQGEISNYKRHSSGHIYFTLKDKQAQLRAAFFRNKNMRLRFSPEDGLEVVVRGRLSIFEMRGEYQIIVEHMEPVGYGALQLAFEQLKKKLHGGGLFDQERKRRLPMLPRKIGIVTSPTGAAIRDMLRTLERRNRTISILIYPAKVQGDGAAEEIAAGIRYLNRLDDIDVMIVGRGGGSLEDLWAFNEEIVARAIYESRIPVISAVGHEIDWTIADFVADLRAPTPTAAAEMVAAARDELVERIQNSTRRMEAAAARLLQAKRSRLDILSRSRGFTALIDRIGKHGQRLDEFDQRLRQALRQRLLDCRSQMKLVEQRLQAANPASIIREQRSRLERQSERLRSAWQRLINGLRSRFELAAGKLNALSPLAVLERGYAICRRLTGEVIKEAKTARAGEKVRVMLARGALGCKVETIEQDERAEAKAEAKKQ